LHFSSSSYNITVFAITSQLSDLRRT